jgi:curli biogenesis system outer membrane secretion channel CsgG
MKTGLFEAAIRHGRLIRYTGLLLAVLFFPLCSVSAVEVESKTVEVTGTGSTLKDAITDGLIEAIGQVAGRFIEAETELENLEVSESDGKDETYFSGQAFRKNIASATKGAVKEYSIIEQGKNEQKLFEVRLSVVCLKVIPSASNRKRMVCATFSFPGEPKPGIFDIDALINASTGKDKPARSIANAFTDNLEAYLVQSRRFMVQDRRNTEALAKEKQIILDGNVPIEDVLRATFDNPADLVVVGGVESVDYVVTTKTMRSGNVIQVGEGSVELSFRVIDVPSKQVKYADRVRYGYTEQDLKKLSGSFAVNRAGSLMMADAANRVGKQILESIYPLKVINVAGDRITLNEGGRGVQTGQIYDVFSLGDDAVDPYTKEKLGQVEVPVGKIKITSSTAKMSSGTVLEKTGDIAEGSICRLSSDQAGSGQPAPAAKKKLNTDDLF